MYDLTGQQLGNNWQRGVVVRKLRQHDATAWMSDHKISQHDYLRESMGG